MPSGCEQASVDCWRLLLVSDGCVHQEEEGHGVKRTQLRGLKYRLTTSPAPSRALSAANRWLGWPGMCTSRGAQEGEESDCCGRYWVKNETGEKEWGLVERGCVCMDKGRVGVWLGAL